ncbi:MAG: hypothetical protein R8M45_07150 [Ghiorsea sp.]
MRYLLITLLGFFGPALVMLILRLLWFQLKQRVLKRRNEPEVIDITPNTRKPSQLFIVTWLTISILCSALLIWEMDSQPASKNIYIPAHIDANGQFIPATP